MNRALPERVPVLVVGAGPVGLALACELGWRGVETLVLDAGDGSVVFPAGEHIFSRTMEHLRRWGIAEDARNLGWPERGYGGQVAFVTSVTGHVLARLVLTENSPFEGVTPEPPLVQAKFKFDPLLRRHAESYDCVTVVHRHEVTGFEQDADGVTVQVRDLDGERDLQVRAAHLVSCEGARSKVRHALGIRYEGEFAQGHNFAVYFRSARMRDLLVRHGLEGATQIQTNASPLRPYFTVVDGRELWRCSTYHDGTSDPDPREVVIQAVGEEIDVEVIRCQPWTGHQVVADRYGAGRVFLAGDAAHLRWPKGGFGANTGVGDAVDLGWKLAAVHAGWGGPELLASYEPERRPIAQRNGRWAAQNWAADQKVPSGPLLEEDTPEGAEARAHAAEVITQERLKEYRTAGVQLGYRYDASPVLSYDGADAPEDRSDTYVQSTSVGARAPHAWLPDGSSTLDHFVAGFTVVRSGSAPELGPLLDAARARAVPLSVLDVDDPETGLLYGEALVLVRPDGHVAWRGPALPADVEGLIDLVRGASVTPASTPGSGSASDPRTSTSSDPATDTTSSVTRITSDSPTALRSTT